ncbi:hypothetical protein QL285_026090 [Trifolium repens]|nr:hypothetical protein QL285_026090 [Trifolium repens]
MSAEKGNDGGNNNNNNHNVNYDYDSNAKDRRSSDKVPFFNGTETGYPFWKTKMYSHIMGIDCDLWDLVEDVTPSNFLYFYLPKIDLFLSLEECYSTSTFTEQIYKQRNIEI